MKADVKAKLDSGISGALSDIKAHFKKDKWDLNFELYTNDVLGSVFGEEMAYVWANLISKITASKLLEVTHKEGRIVITKIILGKKAPKDRAKRKKR